jgi:CBS domain-containing protein
VGKSRQTAMGGTMKLVKHLLDSKGHDVISVAPDLSVFDAIKLMADKLVGSLIVMDGEQLRGIVTERDYARKVIIKGRSSESTLVSEIMSTDVLTTSSSQTVNQCMELMTERRIRHLPVVEDDRVIGMISIGDLVQAIIADQQEAIEQLESYISG